MCRFQIGNGISIRNWLILLKINRNTKTLFVRRDVGLCGVVYAKENISGYINHDMWIPNVAC